MIATIQYVVQEVQKEIQAQQRKKITRVKTYTCSHNDATVRVAFQSSGNLVRTNHVPSAGTLASQLDDEYPRVIRVELSQQLMPAYRSVMESIKKKAERALLH